MTDTPYQEKKKVPNAIEHEEARIKDEERRAKEELEQINRKKNENQVLNFGLFRIT